MNHIKLIFTLLITLSGFISAAEMQMNEMTKEQAYTVLSQASEMTINATSTEKDIQKAYRKSLLKCHPDKNLDQEEKATTNTKWVNHAYEILTGEIQPTQSSSSSSSTPQQQPQKCKKDPEMENAYFENANKLFNQAIECTLGIKNQKDLLQQAEQTLLQIQTDGLCPSNKLPKSFHNLYNRIKIKFYFYKAIYSFYETVLRLKTRTMNNVVDCIEYGNNEDAYFDDMEKRILNLLKKDEEDIQQAIKTCNDINRYLYEIYHSSINPDILKDLSLISAKEHENIKIGMNDLFALVKYELGNIYLSQNKNLKEAVKYFSQAKDYWINPMMPTRPDLKDDEYIELVLMKNRFGFNRQEYIQQIDEELSKADNLIKQQSLCVIQ